MQKHYLIIFNNNCNPTATSANISELQKIPGVGKSIANDLVNIGITKIDNLKGKNPQLLFDQSNEFAGCIQDRCLLYVFKCAV